MPPTNRIMRLVNKTPDAAWIYHNGRWHCCGHTLKCDPPEECTGTYLCECSKCEACEPPEIDLDKISWGDNVEPLNRKDCDDESR